MVHLSSMICPNESSNPGEKNTMKIDSLDTLMTRELQDAYDAEKQITKALPKMVKAVESAELKEALQDHLEVTKNQISRLEEIFGILEQKPKSHPCNGMKGLLEEGDEIVQEDADEPMKDAAIIGAAQKVEHYEIAAYGTLRAYADILGNAQISALLAQTLEEEEEADRKLTEISEGLLSAESSRLGSDDLDMEDEDEAEEPVRAGGSASKAKRSQAMKSKRHK